MVQINEESSPSNGGETEKSLQTLRSRIDALDRELLGLIEQRLALSASAAACKTSDDRSRLRLRPRREAEILDRLVAEATAPEALVRRVWRELMAFGLHAQGATDLVIHAPQRLATVLEQTRARFGSAASMQQSLDIQQCLAVARTREAVAIIELHPLSNWWVDLDKDPMLRIFDAIRDEGGDILALAVGRVAKEDAPPAPHYPIIGAGSLERRKDKGEDIRVLAASGHLRLCVCGTAEDAER